MVSENRGVRDLAFDEGLRKLENGSLYIGSGFTINLIAGKDSDIGLLVVQDARNKIKGPGIGFAVCGGGWWFSMATFANASGEMKV